MITLQVKEIYNKGKEILRNNNIDDETTKARILMCYVLNTSKEQFIIRKEEQIKEDKKELFLSYIEQIKNGTPLQYIVNNQEFMKLNFYVDENVLIPRSDTEILVEEVIENSVKESKILDLCTGSGAIAISIAKYIKGSKVFASDISDNAIRIAKQNAKSNNVDVKFIISNLFEDIIEKDFDIIVSNPPYIRDSVIETLSADVKKEPIIALSGGEDGLDFYRRISKDAHEHLKNNGKLFLEIGYDQKDEVIEILKKDNYEDIYCKRDLAGNDRVIVAKKVGEGHDIFFQSKRRIK